MIAERTFQHQQAFRAFCDLSDWNAPYAVTLTMKPYRFHANHYVRLDHLRAQENLRFFLNRLNKAVYGNKMLRKNLRVPVIPVLEGTANKRLHYHLVIDCPKDELKDRFPQMIEQCWAKTPWAFDHVDIQPNADSGWVNYITKFRDKASLEDAIDWGNLRHC